MTKELSNFNHLIKSIIKNCGLENDFDSDFDFDYDLKLEKQTDQSGKNNRQIKRFKKFIEMCKNKRITSKLINNKIKENVDEIEEKLNIAMPLSLIHSVVEKNTIGEKYYKRFTIPLNILLGIKNYRIGEYAFENIILEKDCDYGLYCPYKSDPLKCPYNHHEISHTVINNCKVILQGQQIPNLFCLYERPWKFYKNTNNQVRCTNPYCWYNHATGRAKLIDNKGYYKYTF